MAYCLSLPHTLTFAYHLAKEWQDLIAGLLAIGGAYLGAQAIYRQTEQAAKIAKQEIDRRHNAARCVLPLALSEISSVCQLMADKIAEEIETIRNATHQVVPWVARRFEPITAPPDTLAAFKDFVETLTDKLDVGHVGQLMAQIQILVSRWNTCNLTEIAPEIKLIGLLIDVARVKLLNDEIFNYARMIDDAPFSIVGTTTLDDVWDRIRGKAQELLFHRPSPDLFFDQLNALIDGRKERESSPWLEKFEW
jgi:hypothetical protein